MGLYEFEVYVGTTLLEMGEGQMDVAFPFATSRVDRFRLRCEGNQRRPDTLSEWGCHMAPKTDLAFMSTKGVILTFN